ncbi:MAG: hypothetical protein KDK99_20640 [Verrucomicrobiales bacterium]|nr:hypothetical protein [Verrucomicrobiales bacterium]
MRRLHPSRKICDMHASIQIDLDLPGDLARFQLPTGVNARLTELLDKQDKGHPLSESEKSEAEGLVDLADTLSYLGLKAANAS